MKIAPRPFSRMSTKWVVSLASAALFSKNFRHGVLIPRERRRGQGELFFEKKVPWTWQRGISWTYVRPESPGHTPKIKLTVFFRIFGCSDHGGRALPTKKKCIKRFIDEKWGTELVRRGPSIRKSGKNG